VLSRTTILVALMVTAFAVGSGAVPKLTFDPSAEEIFVTKGVAKQPTVYSVNRRNLSEEDLNGKLAVLKNHGFVASNRVSKEGKVLLTNTKEDMYLTYESESGKYQFYRRNATGLAATESSDRKGLESVAKGYLRDLLGQDAANYVFENTEEEWEVLRSDPEKRLRTITYRYVRVVEGRRVLGVDCHALLTLGEGRRLTAVEIANPVLTKEFGVGRWVKNNSMKGHLAEYLNGPEYAKDGSGRKLTLLQTDVIRGSESYFRVVRNGRTFLEPHMSFMCQDKTADGETLTREIHLSVDPSRLPNVAEEDIMDLSPKSR